MEQLIATIEKGKPFFNAIARNKYLKAIRDGFISVIPIIIFSSIFILIDAVPNVWGFYWPAEIDAILMKAYNYSMGILALAAAATTAKHFCDAQNRDMPKNNQINFLSVMIASVVGFLILSSDAINVEVDSVSYSGFANGFLGSKGLLTAFISAFVVGIVYKFFVSRNITIKLPDQVPPNISQTFKDLIPFSVSISVFWLFDLIFRNAFGFCFAQGVIQVFQPLFSAADSYVGLAIIYGAMSLFWFVGVHGPSIVEPAISAALVANMSANLTAYQAGEQATHVLSLSSQYFVVCLGGTGATLVICFMFAFLAKSKEMKAIGRASIIPTLFNVNEPFLFGAPMVLNPIFFVPFVFAPICNIWALKIFVDIIGMDGFLYTLPWTVPGPVGIIMGLGFQPLAFVFLAAVLALDFLVYYPFFKVYDREKCAEEAAMLEEELAAKAAAKGDAMAAAFQGKINASSVADDESKTKTANTANSDCLAKLNGHRVLVLCQGGGTSGLLANALAKAAKEHGIDLETGADAYGNHIDMMKDFDLVILAPQAASYFDDLKADCERMGIACCVTRGKQYIDLTRDGEASLRFVAEQLNL
ncbi:lactose/cellobiose PTS transporter subunit IIB [Collinsella tanakaei]|uniref:lactose/cellobiose PTS transporter subunit IIB n=1 Tax=Collinsella tanakaei TaxID=626935 RepID=UPI00265A3F59|nr:lactose/cellobiose PTS transporter subunit IIB [Collinsella tanakaei]